MKTLLSASLRCVGSVPSAAFRSDASSLAIAARSLHRRLGPSQLRSHASSNSACSRDSGSISHRPWLRHVPNALTISRVVAIPGLVAAYYLPHAASARAPAFIFLACALTDWLDGYLARRWRVGSRFGAFLDPVADKLLVCTCLVLLSGSLGAVVALPTAVIIAREILISALREWMAELGQRELVAVRSMGKLKTFTQMVSLAFLLLATPGSVAGQVDADGLLLRGGLACLYASVMLTGVSMLAYVAAAWPYLAR